MSVRPREPLTAEERALAAQLPRLHGSVEPDSKLDARILAAARSAVAAPPARRVRWIAPMAVAASMSLAVGLAWRLQPPGAGITQAQIAEAVVTDQPNARFTTPPADDARANEIVTPAPAAPPERPRPASPRAVAAATESPPVTDPGAAPAPPPPAPPAPPAPPVAAAAASAGREGARDMMAAPTVAPLSSQGMAKTARSSEAARESTSAAIAPRSQANEAARAANATIDDPQPFLADDPGKEVPPATADSPEVRDAWLRRISELLQQDRSEEAKASLAEFRRRYPAAPLPPELRALEP